jgi:cell division protease FtsH
MIATTLGGRAAEEVIFKELTIGAANDIENATKIARKMVTEFGMSSLGPISYNGKDDYGWLARKLSESPAYSQEMLGKIDSEVKSIVDAAYENAKGIVSDKRELLDKVAMQLLEQETIDGDEFREMIGSKRIDIEDNPENEIAQNNQGY